MSTPRTFLAVCVHNVCPARLYTKPAFHLCHLQVQVRYSFGFRVRVRPCKDYCWLPIDIAWFFFTLHSCSMRRSLDCQQKSLYRVCTGYARSGRVSSRPALFSHWRLPVSPVIVQSTLGTRARCVVQFLEHYANVLRHQYVAGVLSCCLQSRKLFIAVYIYTCCISSGSQKHNSSIVAETLISSRVKRNNE